MALRLISMMPLIGSLVLAVAITSQPSNLGVITIGEVDVLAQLKDTDVAVIKERVRNTCAALWLVKAFQSQFGDSQYVQVYCAPAAPKAPDVPLRRGTFVSLRRRPAEPWTVVGEEAYAQVIDDQAAADGLPAGDRDIHRPFRVSGSLSDADLVSLVAYVRSRPPNPKADPYLTRVEGGWPINWVSSKADGTVDVSLSESDLSGQRVTVRKGPNGWEIVSVNFVIA